MNTIVAIDPGKSGGIAVSFAEGTECQAMPATEADIVECLRGVARSALATHAPPVFFIERVGGCVKRRGSSGQPGSAMFTFGDNYGFLKGVVRTLGGLPVLVRPQEWQAPLGLGTASACATRSEWKNKLKSEAQRRFPQLKVTLKTADALLLLAYATSLTRNLAAGRVPDRGVKQPTKKRKRERMATVLQCNESGNFKPHPEGIFPAVCVDVIDLGMVTTEFQGDTKLVNKVKLVFESEQKTEEGKNCIVSRNYTASLHPKAKLSDFLAKWRGRPVVQGEIIDLGKLVGACCTLVVSHQTNLVGKKYASIDAVSKPTKKLVPSGHYDPAAARQRIAEWQAKQQTGGQRPEVRSQSSGASTQSPVHRHQTGGTPPRPSPQNGEGVRPVRVPMPPPSVGPAPTPVATVVAAPADDGLNTGFDPEVGF